jgi:hypothetical protein
VTTYCLYFAACALHLILLYLFSHLQLYRRHPFFMMWLLVAPFSNLAVWVLYWSKEYAILHSAQTGVDVLWYTGLGAGMFEACIAWDNLTSQTLRRGILGLVIFAVIAREAAGLRLMGGFGVFLASAMNLAYLAPTIYLVAKFSGISFDRIPLWLKYDEPWLSSTRQVPAFARSRRT